MKLYHGSSVAIEQPSVVFSRSNLDFGKGFYPTSYPEQAERWAKRKALRAARQAVVSVYEMSEDLSGFLKREFAKDNREWVEFVCSCRRGEDIYKRYDVIIGSVANDKVYTAVDMYYSGLWNMDRTLAALKYYELNDQVCIVSQALIERNLTYLHSYEVTT